CYKARAVNSASGEVISVGELDRRLRRAVEGVTGREWVEGEVSSLKRAVSGHVYFSLKDEREDAVIDCVMYRLSAQRARRHLSEGARLQLLGKATLWAPRGRLQFIADLVRPAGRGAALEALELLKQRLLAEGLFAVERKRRLPAEPRVIGVVTSSVGAAFHDICSVAFRRGAARIVLCPALVQGEMAPESLVSGIDLIERYPGLDVLIIGRGGGSGEDLMAFNDERVVRRVALARVPVVSAVGHEVDVTLTDLVADVRASTPSQAAELVMPDLHARQERLVRARAQLTRAVQTHLAELGSALGHSRLRLGDPRFLVAERQQYVDEMLLRLERLAARQTSRRRSRVENLHRRLASRDPRAVLGRARADLGPLTARLDAAMRLELSRAARRFGEYAETLNALSPLSVLARGYAIATRSDNRALRAAEEAAPGETLTLRLSRGQLGVRVLRVYNGESHSAPASEPDERVGEKS
ncbi:MAG TPA: exodeoxyribonuclease VII large subunit, partial [Polyangiaceae bacterium]|nr:exodeoxyribonuclease VII large subunit [Polyangiaceae bacterium]